jgi:putative restriction endonuclease
MHLFVGVTDYDWFRLHAAKTVVEEVNFWRPSSGGVPFKALQTGEPFLFKLHAPRNFIAGGGFFAKFLTLPVALAWDAFGEANGARSLAEVKQRISKYRRIPIGPRDNPDIGCIILAEPFFFDEPEWIPIPSDFPLNAVQGKGYDTDTPAGRTLWDAVVERLNRRRALRISDGPAVVAAIEGARYGAPQVVMPRLGQGAFRVMVTDTYGRRCAMTNERTLPVLEAAHIRPYSENGPHQLSNGVLLRRDLHTLFDMGYITVDPQERRVVVSGRIREEFENGREYYQLHGKPLAMPGDRSAAPGREFLEYHAQTIFR